MCSCVCLWRESEVCMCVCVCVGISLIGLEWDCPQGAKGISTLRTYKHFSMGRCVCVCVCTPRSLYTPTWIHSLCSVHALRETCTLQTHTHKQTHTHTHFMSHLEKQTNSTIPPSDGTHTPTEACTFSPAVHLSVCVSLSVDFYHSLPHNYIHTCKKKICLKKHVVDGQIRTNKFNKDWTTEYSVLLYNRE